MSAAKAEGISLSRFMLAAMEKAVAAPRKKAAKKAKPVGVSGVMVESAAQEVK